MAKMINPKELAEVVTKLLVDPTGASEGMSEFRYVRFVNTITEAVCEACGGMVKNSASVELDEGSQRKWYIGIHGTNLLPENGGIWADYDLEGDLFAQVNEQYPDSLL